MLRKYSCIRTLQPHQGHSGFLEIVKDATQFLLRLILCFFSTFRIMYHSSHLTLPPWLSLMAFSLHPRSSPEKNKLLLHCELSQRKVTCFKKAEDSQSLIMYKCLTHAVQTIRGCDRAIFLQIFRQLQ